jgi:putative transcription antitermination factor YqgF
MRGSYLALDWGQKKIGWATGDELQITTTAHPVYIRPAQAAKWQLCEADKKWLRQILDEWQPKTLALGNPLGLDGSENQESHGAAELSQQLIGFLKDNYTNIEVVLVNEALSTWESRGKKNEDSEAAAILLKDLWNSKKSTGD